MLDQYTQISQLMRFICMVLKKTSEWTVDLKNKLNSDQEQAVSKATKQSNIYC